MFPKAIPALFALLAALPSNAFFILSQEVLVTTRLDPIVNPGVVSGHVHSIAGGSNFDKTMDFASARRSKCTTAPVSVDMSNYWIPQLYYYNPVDQSYQMITVAYVNTYYLPRGNGKISAFPDGLRMIAGNPSRRSMGTSAEDKAISFVCLDYYNSHAGDKEWDQRNSFFNHNCPDGMRAQVNFPSCWDGKNLDSPNHKSHMAYASGGPEGGGDCPSTHPVHLVTLFYEFIYETQKLPFNNGSDPSWVFANGDTTGYGLHGDFLNGWPSLVNGTNILQQAIDGCNANNGVAGNLKECPPFVPVLNYDAASACRPENPQVNEDIGLGHSIPLLPGDNPIWIGNGTKPTAPGYVEANTTYTDFKSIVPAGYTYTGCVAESTNGRALQGAVLQNDNMTVAGCVSWCQQRGFPLAAMEFGRECYCGAKMMGTSSNTTLLSNDKCNVACAANGNELCGGANTLSLYNNPSMYIPPVMSVIKSGYSLTGCIAEASSGRALQGASLSNGNMTRGACVSFCSDRGFPLAGVEYGQECFCGSAFSGSATNATLLPDDRCGMPCANNKGEACGGPGALTLFNNPNMYPLPVVSSSSSSVAATTAANKTTTAVSVNSTTSSSTSITKITTTAAVVTTTTKAAVNTTTSATTSTPVPSPTKTPSIIPSGYKITGCIAEASSGRALTGASFSNANMTLGVCVAWCQSRNYPLAGIEYGRECYCDSAMRNGASNTTILPNYRCGTVCAGSKGEDCGGPGTITLFNNPGMYPIASLPTGWSETGCMTEVSGDRALRGYTFAADNMTPKICLTECQSRGYKLAGAEYGRECWCSNAFTNGSIKAVSSQCSMGCAGDNTQACGGPDKLTTWSFANSTTAAPKRRSPSRLNTQ